MVAKKLLSTVFAAFVVAACHSSVSAGAGTTSTTAAKETVDPGAIEQLTLEATQARCARAYSCGEIREKGGRWVDYGSCMSAMRREVRDDLIGRQCKEGFDPDAAASCIHALQDARCEDARDLRSTRACESALRCR